MIGKKVLAGVAMISLLVWASAAAPLAARGASSSITTPGEIITLKIEGMTCASCAGDIREALVEVPGVKRAEVSYARGGAIVEIEPGRVSNEQLVRAVASAGTILSSYRATVVPNGTLTAEAAGDGTERSWFDKLFK